MSYKLEFSNNALSKLEALGRSDAKKLRQIFMKILSLRRTPFPNDSKKLESFSYKGLNGYRVDQGEYRIIYAIDETNKRIIMGPILNRNEDYKELKNMD
ncbi:MAG: type II toxin-antitoxin system RelE/ParE family toxin [Desulfobacteraceae bacterium]|nr:type II toxin-antitoxin system RelE/ParE family toxin [Desulfobacteraceae bacterium]